MAKKREPIMPSKKKLPKTYFIKTFGCQMNVSDSERIAGFLETQKLKLAENIREADLVIFNTCGVRQMAEDRAYGQIHNLRKNNPEIKIILTGCLANRQDARKRLKDKVDLFFSINDFSKFENWLIKNYLKISARKKIPPCSNYLSINPKYSDMHSAFVPIMTGCDNFCSYCIVPYARGREVSRPIQDIFKEIENLVYEKYQKITLLGQNVNSYFHKISPSSESISTIQKSEMKNIFDNRTFAHAKTTKITFPILLNFLAQSFPKINFSFLTSHPKDFSEKLMKIIAQNENINREIHLPIQSGSDKILRAMNRPYTRKHYLSLIKKAQKIIPNVSFTTDIIIGFPSETEKDFLQTVDIFQKVKYNEAYLNKYSPRPGTVAIKLGDPISWEEKKRREKILREILQKKYNSNE